MKVDYIIKVDGGSAWTARGHMCSAHDSFPVTLPVLKRCLITHMKRKVKQRPEEGGHLSAAPGVATRNYDHVTHLQANSYE